MMALARLLVHNAVQASSLVSIRQLHLTCATHSVESTHPSFYDSTVEKYAQQPLEVISMQQMIDWGRKAWQDPANVLKSARHVQRELPKRLARRLLDLQLLPYIVVTNPHIKHVYDGYRRSFDELRRFPQVKTAEDNTAFNSLLREHLDQHAVMLDRLAAGLRECKSKQLVGPCLQLDSFFDNMLRSRISRRVIAEQHLHLSDKKPGYIGIICTDLKVREAVEFAAQKTRQICTETFGVAPDIIISGHRSACIQYIPAHLDYMLFELCKNAARAVVETHHQNHNANRNHDNGSASSQLSAFVPPIHVRICDGVSDLTIRISDQGGGVPARLLHHIWSYGFSTVGMNDSELDRWVRQPEAAAAASGAGLGASTSRQHYTGAAPLWDSSSTSSTGSFSPDDDAAFDSATGLPDDLMGTSGVLWPSAKGAALVQPQRQADNNDAVDPGMGSGFGFAGLHAGISESGDLGGRFRMAGLGFGLPLSRLYSRYFGGDLTLKVMPGYGTDAYLTLKRHSPMHA